MNIFVPDLIRRRPRSICDHAHLSILIIIMTTYCMCNTLSLHIFKVLNFKDGFCGTHFQCSMVSCQILTTTTHYSCFVASIGMLLEAHITSESLEKANALLETFCRKMSDLYGEYEYYYTCTLYSKMFHNNIV